MKRHDGTYFHVSLAELRFERKLAPSTSESNRAYVQYLFDSKKLSETRKKEKQQAIKTAHKRNSNNSQGSITLKDSSSNLEKINIFF